jgi:plasmid stabilization system protein ParE
MNRLIRLHEDATIDLEDHVSYIAQTDRDRAFRFFDAARQTFTALSKIPILVRSSSGGNFVSSIPSANFGRELRKGEEGKMKREEG